MEKRRTKEGSKYGAKGKNIDFFRRERYETARKYHEPHLSPHDGARPHAEEGRGHAGGEDDIDCNQQSRVFLPIYLFEDYHQGETTCDLRDLHFGF